MTPRPPTGGAMDRAIVPRRLPRRLIYISACTALLSILVLAYLVSPGGTSQAVDTDRLTISSVTKGMFEDYLPLRARITPLVTVFLDAVEGGRVEEVLVEDGVTVSKGQLLAVLSNSELQLSTLARQTEVEQQLNNMRSQELALSRSDIQNKRDIIEAELAAARSERLYNLQRKLAKDGFVSARTFADVTDQFHAERQRLDVLRTGAAKDERLQVNQLAQLREAASGLSSSLVLARASLNQLNLRAPVAGQLTAFSIQVGQSMKRGERLGQIDSPGRNKIIAGVDEFYLSRVALGQRATLEWNDKTYQLKVSKISPEVRNGEFEIECQFIGVEPTGVQRGQTMQARLTLGSTERATLIPNGAYYNDTGGSWVFVVAENGSSAVKRTVRLGRRNARYIEVVEGLDPGERVITSPYTGFADKDRLAIRRR
jgi:HlyD family secretion protein